MIRKILLLFFIVYAVSANSQSLETFHDFIGIKINGDTLNFSDLAGKKVLVVNTASYCAYTPQYADLEQLYLQYGGPDFAILGFPCNDFGGQEPGSDGQIDTFCTNNYSVTFQMMKKISITAVDTAEVYKWLQLQSRNGVADAPVLWNFQKFMIDEAGHWHDYALSAVTPFDTSITDWITSPSVLALNENIPDVSVISFNPNPCKDRTTINLASRNLTDATIKLYDVKGRFIKQVFAGTFMLQNKIEINAAELNNGIYFLKIETARESKFLKLSILK
jgi:glutathione peroxidase